MTELEQRIIEIITQNRHLSEELKKRYILAMFLMETEKQREYLLLLEAFEKRCGEMDRGVFIVKPSEMKQILRTYEDAKKDILRKLNLNNQNQ
ncbi:hypothetical protein KKA33_01255 [Patescibacteria group bacterium]|nr:hypothetical protein [Patescibacteria group bacterium]